MKPHAFIAMPFGTKPGADGQPIDFNRIHAELLQPALEDAGFEVFRADEEQRAGDIRTDMFQELLAADLVVADLTLDNPNVWYELGVRHALRARGVVLVQGPRATNPFDIYTDRMLHYSLAAGAPDPATLQADRARLAAMARETMQASTRRNVSPVYALLPHLQQPDWQTLLIEQDNEFSDAYRAWQRQLGLARQKKQPGDILVLAAETPVRALQVQARRDAGNALLTLKQYAFALEQFDAALALAPDDRPAQHKRVVCLGRLGRDDEALEAVRALTDHDGDKTDPEAWALAGRIEKERWIARWRVDGATTAALRQAAGLELASLDEALAAYLRAFEADARHSYSGINALTLRLLSRHLGGEVAPAALDGLAGGVAWSVHAAAQRSPRDYWARASLAELCLLRQPRAAVQTEFRAAAAAAKGDWFALDSTRQTLALLRDLEFRPDDTAAALAILDAEIQRLKPPADPRQVLLFSGHMVDAPGRTPPRLPPSKVPAAAAAIEQALDALGAGAGDLMLTQGAAGGDLLFAEACARRGVQLQFLLPLHEPEFIAASILPSADGVQWRQRWWDLQPRATLRVMPDDLGPPPPGTNAFERCNLWLLATALACGPQKVRFVCLWDGGGGDGPGGTRHMHDEVQHRTGRVTWIDTRTLP